MIDRDALTSYLVGVLRGPVEVLTLRPLKDAPADAEDDPKRFGYGVPFEVECLVAGSPRSFVVSRTRVARGFGHDYPADRAWQSLYGHAAYNSFPRHVRSVDVGGVRESGALVSVADATEFFQLVEKAEGKLYWLDLDRLLTEPLRPLDTERARALGTFLAEAHAVERDEPTLYERRIRELVGHGECLMGILDSYPHPYPFLPPAACEAIERDAVSWRWRLRGRADRLAALAINYLFFGLRKGAAANREGVAEPFVALFRAFLDAYASVRADEDLGAVLPPFLAFRALVIAHPRWYPALTAGTRRALIGFAQRLMANGPVDPARVLELLGDRS